MHNPCEGDEPVLNVLSQYGLGPHSDGGRSSGRRSSAHRRQSRRAIERPRGSPRFCTCRRTWAPWGIFPLRSAPKSRRLFAAATRESRNTGPDNIAAAKTKAKHGVEAATSGATMAHYHLHAAHHRRDGLYVQLFGPSCTGRALT